MIALIGSEGSMGKRYQAVLTHLREPFTALDKIKDKEDHIEASVRSADKILLASPTDTHVALLRKYLPLKKPILCEKPVCRDLDELIELHAECSRNGWRYQMVMQYRELDIPFKTPDRWSYYNYFRHGNDGLAWDCTQTIALANGPVSLKEDSPIWECAINGQILSIKDMDRAYVEHTRKFINGTLDQTMDDIMTIHKKVHAWKEANEIA